jgi:hypothetical protein
MIGYTFRSGAVYTFRSAALRAAPRWLRRTNAFRVLLTVALHLDALAEAATDGLRLWFPGYSPQTLPIEGRERRVRRGFDESDDSYAARQLAWLDNKRRLGDPHTILVQLAGYLTPHAVRMRIVNHWGEWITRNADGTFERHTTSPKNWNWDGAADADAWSRFWVIIYASSIWTRTTWGAGAWGSGTWGSTATSAQIQSMRLVVADAKAAHSRCQNIILAFDDASFDPTAAAGSPMPDGTWGPWGKLSGGVALPSRLGTALYADGE